jgi:hypothetical protein
MKSSPQPIYQQSEKQHNQAYNQETTTKQQNACTKNSQRIKTTTPKTINTSKLNPH